MRRVETWIGNGNQTALGGFIHIIADLDRQWCHHLLRLRALDQRGGRFDDQVVRGAAGHRGAPLSHVYEREGSFCIQKSVPNEDRKRFADVHIVAIQVVRVNWPTVPTVAKDDDDLNPNNRMYRTEVSGNSHFGPWIGKGKYDYL